MKRLACAALAAALLLVVFASPVVAARKTISAPASVVAGEPFLVTGTGAEPDQYVVVILWAKGCDSYSTVGSFVAADGTWIEHVQAGWSIGCTGEVAVVANQSTDPFGFRRIARTTVTVE